MARTYKRDANGRFAGGGGGSGRVTGGSLKARTSARRSRAKLAAKDPGDSSLSGTNSRRAQRAAVTRTGKAAAAARTGNRARAKAARVGGTVGKPRGLKPGAIRPKASPSKTGGKPPAAKGQGARLKWQRQSKKGMQSATLPNGRRVNVVASPNGKSASATVLNKDGSPRIGRKDFRNVTEAKQWAANPSARGPRLGARYNPSMKRRKSWEMPSDASPGLGIARRARSGRSGTVSKPRGLKPQSGRKLRLGIALSRQRAVNANMQDRPDLAQVNIKGRFTGQAGKRMDASIDRAVKQVKAVERARLMKPKEQVKAEQAARTQSRKQAEATRPKRVRSAESMRASRARQITKRRSISMNPAGWRYEASSRMAANAERTQKRALNFYGRRR